MGILSSADYLTEKVSKKYMSIDRFVPSVCMDGQRSHDLQFKMDIALDAETKMIKSKITNFPCLPKKDREYSEYDIITQMTFMMCTRITNLYKCLFILHQFCRNADFIITKLEYIKEVLQKEFMALYGIRYNPLLESDKIYRSINGEGVVFTEYIIYNDLLIYFQSSKINDAIFYMCNKKQLLQYMCIIYLEIECEFLRSDIESELMVQKKKLDFIQFYDYVKKSKQEMFQLYDFMNTLLTEVDGSSIYDAVYPHNLIILSENATNMGV